MVQPNWQKRKSRFTWSCAKLEDFGIAVKKVNNNGLFTPEKMKKVNNDGLFTTKKMKKVNNNGLFTQKKKLLISSF
jgi:hypothetical protein